VTTTVCSPVAALDGMMKFASTVPDTASEKFVVVSDPSVTLVIGALAGGDGGLPGNVMVKLMFVPVPRRRHHHCQCRCRRSRKLPAPFERRDRNGNCPADYS